jgi:hypothetical protein
MKPLRLRLAKCIYGTSTHADRFFSGLRLDVGSYAVARNESEVKATEDCYASKMLEESNDGGAQAGST